jgi:phenylalanyl-tRNA synthetase beta subunit
MQRTTLMLELEPRQVKALLAFTRQVSRDEVKRLLGDDVDPEAVISALEEFHWQLASSGDRQALELMSRYG